MADRVKMAEAAKAGAHSDVKQQADCARLKLKYSLVKRELRELKAQVGARSHNPSGSSSSNAPAPSSMQAELDELISKNRKLKEKRRELKAQLAERQQRSATAMQEKTVWQFENHMSKWQPYDDDLSKHIAELHVKWESQGRPHEIFKLNDKYAVDFHNMQQENVARGTKRKLRTISTAEAGRGPANNSYTGKRALDASNASSSSNKVPKLQHKAAQNYTALSVASDLSKAEEVKKLQRELYAVARDKRKLEADYTAKSAEVLRLQTELAGLRTTVPVPPAPSLAPARRLLGKQPPSSASLESSVKQEASSQQLIQEGAALPGASGSTAATQRERSTEAQAVACSSSAGKPTMKQNSGRGLAETLVNRFFAYPLLTALRQAEMECIRESVKHAPRVQLKDMPKSIGHLRQYPIVRCCVERSQELHQKFITDGFSEWMIRLLSDLSAPLTPPPIAALSQHSQDYALLKHMFMKSIVSHRLQKYSEEWAEPMQLEVVSITPVGVSRQVLERYLARCEELSRKKLPEPMLPNEVWRPVPSRDANEVFLFHGTRWDNVDSIASKGFDEKKAKDKGMFGAGAYLAPNASKCDKYTDQNAAGERCILLARVALGVPFPRYKGCDCVTHPPDGFDSIVAVPKQFGGAVDHPEVAVFSRKAALPFARIVYRHKPSCQCHACSPA